MERKMRKSRIELVATDEEARELREAADRSGQSLGSFLRTVGLSVARKSTPRPKRQVA